MNIFSALSFKRAALCILGISCASFITLVEAENEQAYYQLLSELRCPQCEGQSLAESSSPIAESLRQQIGRMLEQGQSPIQIKTYLVKRYGEEVLMVPNSSSHRLLLWGLPLLFLLVLLLHLYILYKRRVFRFRSAVH